MFPFPIQAGFPGRFFLSVIEVLLLPGQADGPGFVCEQEGVIEITHLPLLIGLVELDDGCPANLQGTY